MFGLGRPKTCLINCEFLISNTGLILVCDKQIRHFKLTELPDTLYDTGFYLN